MHTTDTPTVHLERTFDAPPARVFGAWLDPALVGRWMAPGDFGVVRVEIDARVGGYFRVWHTGAGGDAGGFESEILDLVPDERLVLRWGFVGPERVEGPVYDSLLTVTFRPSPAGGTVLTLVHERLDALAAALPAVADGVAAGWDSVTSNLATLLRSD
jgi:uncharacterized protein YndB with AHSA1/START domain